MLGQEVKIQSPNTLNTRSVWMRIGKTHLIQNSLVCKGKLSHIVEMFLSLGGRSGGDYTRGGRVTGNWVSRIEEDIGSGGAYHPPSHQGAQQEEPLYFLDEGTGTLHGHWMKIVFGHSKINNHQISFPLNLLYRIKFIPKC